MRIAVYWDIDGTLLLSPPGRADLYRVTIEAFGGTPVQPAEPRDGLTDRRVGEMYLEAAGMPLGLIDDFLAELDRQSTAYYVLHPRRLMPGAVEAVAEVAARGWRQALMSGNTPARMRTKLSTAGLDPDAFDAATSVSGGFVSDRRELGRRARALSGDDRLVVVGDTPHDLLAARAAGAPLIAVTDRLEVRAALRGEALAVLPTLADPGFLRALERLAGQAITPNV